MQWCTCYTQGAGAPGMCPTSESDPTPSDPTASDPTPVAATDDTDASNTAVSLAPRGLWCVAHCLFCTLPLVAAKVAALGV